MKKILFIILTNNIHKKKCDYEAEAEQRKTHACEKKRRELLSKYKQE